jgi:hypothetical protein
MKRTYFTALYKQVLATHYSNVTSIIKGPALLQEISVMSLEAQLKRD